MTHKDLIEIGFRLKGVEDNDPYYLLIFKPPFLFGVSMLSGELLNGVFFMRSDSREYTSKEELKKVVEIVGGEIRNETF